MNASGVATCSSRTLVQMPSASRKVSRPDSLEMPAPVRMTMRSGRCMPSPPDQQQIGRTPIPRTAIALIATATSRIVPTDGRASAARELIAVLGAVDRAFAAGKALEEGEVRHLELRGLEQVVVGKILLQ